MPKTIIKPKTKRKVKTASAAAAPPAVYDIHAIGRRHALVRTGAEGLELELVITTDSGEKHLATLVFDSAEATKLRDALIALVK